jgi:HME family heavy-metal exporter
LVSSTLLDSLLTPLLFWLVGREPTNRLLRESTENDAELQPQEAF